VPIKKFVSNEYIICLEDGRKLKTLRRHFKQSFGMTPEQYRAHSALPADYSMVAPSYAAKRSALANPTRRANPYALFEAVMGTPIHALFVCIISTLFACGA